MGGKKCRKNKGKLKKCGSMNQGGDRPGAAAAAMENKKKEKSKEKSKEH